MSILETLFGENKEIISFFEQEMGITTSQIESVAGYLFPKVTQNISNIFTNPDSMNQMMQSISAINFSELASNSKDILSPKTIEIGQGLLKTILGGDDAINNTIQDLSSTLNIGIETLNRLVPSLMTAIVSTVMNNSGGLSSMISTLFQSDATGGGQSDLSKLVGSMLGEDASDIFSKLLTNK